MSTRLHFYTGLNRVSRNVAEIFKTPGKLRGKTPRTARKINPLETRVVSGMDTVLTVSNIFQPLSDVFSSTPRGGPSPFRQIHFERPAPTFQVAEDEPEQREDIISSTLNTTKESPPKPSYNTFDSGYYGSQANDATQPNEPRSQYVSSSIMGGQPPVDDTMELYDDNDQYDENVEILGRDSEERRTTEGSFRSAKEEQTRNALTEVVTGPGKDQEVSTTEKEVPLYPVLQSPLQSQVQQHSSPQKRSPHRVTPGRLSPLKQISTEEIIATPEPEPSPVPLQVVHHQSERPGTEQDDEIMDDVQSPSDGSSPIRPIVRKSSLNFASLPAREPITTKKSIGNRVSRTSHLDQSRTSYYGRQTGGKSIGNARRDEDDEEDMDVDQLEGTHVVHNDDTDTKLTRMHNKTSTQRLQDQISMLGQSQSNVRPSKSLASGTAATLQQGQASSAMVLQEPPQQKSPLGKQSPQHSERPPPGAFPEDEDESWIGPPPAAGAGAGPSMFSPRPKLVKSHTCDVMEDIYGKEGVAISQFDIPKRGDQQRNLSPAHEPNIPERTTATLGHVKSVSTSIIRSPRKVGDSPGSKKGISVSNPTPSVYSADEEIPTTPPKSPARSHRGSPLKAAKDKFSSILKSSRGLFASSAAVSAEAKSSALSPPTPRTGLQQAPSLEDILSQANDKISIYPNLDAHNKESQLSFRMPESPFKASPRKTRASTEREEKKREEEAQRMDSQLEKARLKVREDAHRDFLEQERAATMQKEFASRKEVEKQAKTSQIDIPRSTRSSPRKTKAQLEAEGIAAAAASTDELASKDIDVTEASHAMPPPAIPRPKSQIGRPGVKRPLKPAKEPLAKAKPPTFIRVDTGSQRGHQYHPSNTTLAATLHESLGASQPSGPSQSLRHKASDCSIRSKSSTASFKSAATKALESAAKKKEQVRIYRQILWCITNECPRMNLLLNVNERRSRKLRGSELRSRKKKDGRKSYCDAKMPRNSARTSVSASVWLRKRMQRRQLSGKLSRRGD
jgi:hypothetical protein